MFLAMNRFKIALGFEDGFEKVWRERDSYLSEVEGFVSFNLMKGMATARTRVAKPPRPP